MLLEPAQLDLAPEAAQQLITELGPQIENAVANRGARAAVDAFFEVVCPSFWAASDDDTRNRIRDNAPLLFATLEREAAEVEPEDLAKIEHPVLVLEGATSHPLFGSINRVLVEQLPNARFVEIEECGHVIQVEQPAAFAQAVMAFVEETAGSSTISSA